MSENSQNAAVRAFYNEMPFNYWSDVEKAADSVRTNPLLAYRDLDDLLDGPSTPSVLELGCGAGWASNALALHYDARVTAVDFTAAALARARAVATQLGVSDQITFIESDLFSFNPGRRFDLVVSLGVLHHTHDCRAAFAKASGLVRPGGHLFVGLYHSYGRRPFLEMFQAIIAEEGEDAAFRRYAALHRQSDDADHVRSWFRDQVLHPQESQHSLEEVMGWLDQDGLDLMSTSINRYGDVTDRSALISDEKAYEELSIQRNRVEGQYFPGFFTVLARRGPAG